MGTPEGITKARDSRRHGVIFKRWHILKFDAFRGILGSTIPGRGVDNKNEESVYPDLGGP